MVRTIKSQKPITMKKQSQIEKTAISFALQIFKLIGTFPVEEKSTFGSDLAREARTAGQPGSFSCISLYKYRKKSDQFFPGKSSYPVSFHFKNIHYFSELKLLL